MQTIILRNSAGMDSARSKGALALHRFLLRFALAGVQVFAWIFLFHFFYLVGRNLSDAFAQTMLLYALSNTVACLFTPYGARVLRAGARRALTFALLFAAAALVILGAAFEGFWGLTSIGVSIALFGIFIGIYRALYWIPYELEAAAERNERRRSLLAEFLVALAPALGGLCIVVSASASVWLLYVGAGIILLSCLPLLCLRDVYEGFSWGYRQTFHQLLASEHRSLVTRAFFEGVSGAALLLMWPLAIFLITGWSYGLLGVVLSLTFIAAILLRTPIRALMRRLKLQESRLLSTVLVVTPWLFRLSIATPLGAVLTDSYFYTTTPRRFGLDPLIFEQTSDGGSLLDEYTALKEMALSLGKVAVCILGAAVALAFSVPIALIVAFVCAALTSAVVTLRL